MKGVPIKDSEILTKLEEIIRDVLDSSDLQLTLDTTAADVDGWDSLAHIRILVAVEADFGVHFSVQEIASLDDVGVFVALIAEKKVA